MPSMSARCARSRIAMWIARPARKHWKRWRKRWHHEIHSTREYMLIVRKRSTGVRACVCFIALTTAAFAQQYAITTAAGGAPPATPAPAGSVSIGQPNRVATDSAGNIYFSASNAVLRMSTAGTLTLVAGNSRAGFSGDDGPAVRAQLN